MSIDIEQFHSVFFEESEEHLDDMEQLLMGLNVDAPDPEELNSIFRAAHSIKGGSGIFGFDALTNLTHVMENLLDKARNCELRVTTDIINVLLETLDVLKATLDAYRQQSAVPEEDIAHRITALNAVINNQAEVKSADTDSASCQNIDEEDGFGFFDDDSTPHAETAKTDADDSFGFFDMDETPSQTSNVADEDGFGFFDNDEAPASTDKQTPTPTPTPPQYAA